MSEYMSFHELMQIVKDGDLVKNESSNRTALEFVDGILRYRGGGQSKYDYPWNSKYKIVKPEPEMVTRIRPKYFARNSRVMSTEYFYKDKEHFFENYKGARVIEWETITVPKNKEDWNDVDNG